MPTQFLAALAARARAGDESKTRGAAAKSVVVTMPASADAVERYLSTVLPGELASINGDVAELANAVQGTLALKQDG